MKEFFNSIVGPLVVAGIVALVVLAFRISLQMASIEGQFSILRDEVHRNRAVTCRFAKELNILVADCPVRSQD